MNALGRGEPADAERRGDPVHRRRGGRAVEPPPAAEKALGVEIAQHQIGVGDRRLGAAIAVAGRAGGSTGAQRADMQDAGLIDSGDRAAAGADAGDVEAVERDRVAGDLAPARQGRPAGDNQRDVGAGPAHVERDQIARIDQPRRMDAAGHTAGRPGEHRARRQPASFGDWRHAAMRLDDQGRPLIPGRGEPLFEPPQIAGHGRPDIGVHDRGRDPLEFLDLRQYLRGERDIRVGQFPLERRARRLLMARVAPGVQIAHRHRLDPFALQHRDRLVERARIERNLDPAVGAQPLAHAKPEPARDQLLGRRQAQIVAVVLEPLAHLDDVAVTLSG